MDLNYVFLQIVLFLTAFVANLLAAFAGGGAGLVQLPILILFGLQFPVALSTHKIASVFLGIGSCFRHLKEKSLNLKFSIFILFTGLPGVYFGSKIALEIPSNISIFMLGVLTILIGLYSLNNKNLGIYKEKFKKNLLNLIICGFGLFAIGFINGSLSSGTGLFVTLWLVKSLGMPYDIAIAHTLVLVGLFWNGAGAITLSFSGKIMIEWLPTLILGSFIGGLIGSHLSIKSSNYLVKKVFEFVSILMGLSLILRSALIVL
tara:strand:- start:21586 stop:22368 length:783 start_codon:yes stop_codon:yes gene_type:complete